MKTKIIIALMALFPLLAHAQSNWEVPTETTSSQQKTTDNQNKPERPKKTVNPKYLAGAIPEVNGKVVFTLNKKVPGKSAAQIYNIVYGVLDSIAHSGNQLPISRILVVNKAEHTVAAVYKEWMIFQNTLLYLDRAIFNYTLIAKAEDDHIKVTMERMNFEYETSSHDPNSGLVTDAEGWITDRYALNKKKNKLVKYAGKFRKATIDRKDVIFKEICQALGVRY